MDNSVLLFLIFVSFWIVRSLYVEGVFWLLKLGLLILFYAIPLGILFWFYRFYIFGDMPFISLVFVVAILGIASFTVEKNIFDPLHHRIERLIKKRVGDDPYGNKKSR